MLRMVDDDAMKRLYSAYMEARATNPQFAENLKDALKVARKTLPQAKRPYDLKRRMSRALKRFRSVQGVASQGKTARIVKMPAPKVVRIFPDIAPKIGA